MEWNAVLEDELQQAKRHAPWRWLGWVLALVGTWLFLGGIAFAVRDPAAPMLVLLIPGALVLALALWVAMPAEKAAKRARSLAVQKKAASEKSSD